jgi:hypothetical protein
MKRTSARLQVKTNTSKANADPEQSSHLDTPPPRKRVKVSESTETDASGASGYPAYPDDDASDAAENNAAMAHEDEEPEVPKPRKSKHGVKQSKGKGKGRPSGLVAADPNFKKVRGKLGLLNKVATEMPLDVVFEVGDAHILFPLRLSRTSKDLRNLLTAKSSGCIWRAARLNVEGLPPPPSDLNEIQYANLMFDAYCHVTNFHCLLRLCII